MLVSKMWFNTQKILPPSNPAHTNKILYFILVKRCDPKLNFTQYRIALSQWHLYSMAFKNTFGLGLPVLEDNSNAHRNSK